MWKELIDNCDCVLFDLDGTVIDSMWVWRQIDIDYFNGQGLDFPEDYQDKIEGMSVYETACFTKEHYNIKGSIQEILDHWDKMAYDHYANDIPLKEGAKEFIQYLNKKGKKLGIATSNSDVLCNLVLNKYSLDKYLDVVLTSSSNLPGKPAPDIYLKAAKELNVNPGKVLVFEDLCNGIKAGNAAGMTTIAISDEYSMKSWEEKIQLANFHIDGYKEILDEILNS